MPLEGFGTQVRAHGHDHGGDRGREQGGAVGSDQDVGAESDDAAGDEENVLLPARENPAGNFPEATPKGLPRKLCIGMATFDDYDGVYFSVQALRMYHPGILDQIDILIIDNNPAGAAAAKLKELDSYIPNYRYVPESEVVGTAIRDRIFQESNAEFVLVMDCHVFVVPGALARLLASSVERRVDVDQSRELARERLQDFQVISLHDSLHAPEPIIRRWARTSSNPLAGQRGSPYSHNRCDSWSTAKNGKSGTARP